MPNGFPWVAFLTSVVAGIAVVISLWTASWIVALALGIPLSVIFFYGSQDEIQMIRRGEKTLEIIVFLIFLSALVMVFTIVLAAEGKVPLKTVLTVIGPLIGAWVCALFILQMRRKK
jgi:Na+-driven multidrug efflux pump